MKADTVVDFALFQLSPKHSRCELLVSSDGNTEKLASGLVNPFLSHLKAAEEQVVLAVQSIKLEIERHKNAETWFTKGTLERFVQFVSKPEVLEIVNTFDAEMSQLEAARRIYSQGAGDQPSDSQGRDGTGVIAAADATTKELLRAIDVRLGAVRQDLTTACARATASGFNPQTVSQLQHFAHRFGAHRLNEACSKYMSLCERRPDLISLSAGDRQLRSSVGSDMSIDEDQAQLSDPPKPSTWQQPRPFTSFGLHNDNKTQDNPSSARRLSVQDRINLFENKQKESSSSPGTKPIVGKSVELCKLPSDVSLATEKSVLRRWSGASDMSIDVSGDKKDTESPLCTPSSPSSVTQTKSNDDKDCKNTSNSEAEFNNAEQVVRTDRGYYQDTSKVSVIDQHRTGDGFKDTVGSEVFGRKCSQLSSGVVTTAVRDVMPDAKFSARRENASGMTNRLVAPSLVRGSHGHSRSLSAQFEGGIGLTLREASVPGEVDQSTPQPHLRSFNRGLEDSSFSSKQQIVVEDSELSKLKYQKLQPDNREQISKLNGKRSDIWGSNESSKLNLPSKDLSESNDNAQVTSIAPSEQVQRVRQSKGNQGLHDELKMKADELEKLFAEHKLRVPGDQSGSGRRIEPADVHVEQAIKSQYRRPGLVQSTPQLPSRNTLPESTVSSSNVASFNAKSVMETVDSQNYSDALRQSVSDLNFVHDSRGKFYEKYMEKRNAKLKEEWGSNRVEKEARMKAMQDSLERSRAEMKAKFSGSINRQESVSGAHRSEKLGYFKSNMKIDQHPIDSLQNEEAGDFSELWEEKIYGASRQTRKNLPNRHISSGTPRTTTASISRSSGRRRENPLAQSVPNFSDLRKENTNPSSGVSKTNRPQGRNYARSKSSTEEMQDIQEEKPKQTQSLRKSSVNPAEFKDLSPLNSDDVILIPFDQTDLGPCEQPPRSFLKNGNSMGPGSVGKTIRMKASVAYTQQNEDCDELESEVEGSLHMAIEEQDVIETMVIDDSAYNNNGKVRLNQESEKSGNSGSEVGDSTRSLSQVDPVSLGEMSTTFPSTFNGVGSLQDSPIESPVSWNSRMRHPFSYPHESSDIDASVDSPIGSPASWNSHSLTQGENDAARMRKKWGSAQKPFLVANSSQNQPRKDVTKGFKRLLKFGRKNRGSESLVDWISATTSEGDDDIEDCRDPANHSSEDSRKSRMGFSHGHPSDDSYNESELFIEQVQSLQSSIPAPPAHFKLRDDHLSGSSLKAPKSFFLLSSFRSKGSDSKPR